MNLTPFTIIACIFFSSDFNINAAPNGLPVKDRILNGSIAYKFRFPFVAAINVRTATAQFFCGGAYYGNEFIITAAQCVQGAISFNITLGSPVLPPLDPEGFIITATNYTAHPQFNPTTLENDIAIIRLPQIIINTAAMDSIKRLPIRPIVPDPYLYLQIFGWGQIAEDGPDHVNQLYFGTQQMISNDVCKLIYGDVIKDTMFCAIPYPDANQTTCTGDVGSPVYADYTIVGISSFFSGRGCANLDPSGFTRIYPYNEWIYENAHNIFTVPPFTPLPTDI